VSWQPGGALVVTAAHELTGGMVSHEDSAVANVAVWDGRTGRLVRRLPGSGAAFNPDGRSLVTWRYSGVHVFDVPSLRTRAHLSGRMSAELTPDGALVLMPALDTGAPDVHSGDQMGSRIEVRDARTLKLRSLLEAYPVPHAISPDGSRVAVGRGYEGEGEFDI